MSAQAGSSGSVVFVVDAGTVALTEDDVVLADAVGRRGRTVRPVVWGSPLGPDERVLIRSPYDYVDRPAEFWSWLDALDASGVAVINPTPLLRWNMHKGYLTDLAARGVVVVPTEIVAQGSTGSLAEVMDRRMWSRVVVKPAVGASARETIAVDSADAASMASGEAHIARVARREDLLVQPFVESIEVGGEESVVVLGDEIAHVVVKRPSSGEWRVQSDFGGSAARVPVTADHEQFVEATLGAVAASTGERPTYARVDVVRVDGVMHLMELELIEPELFFRLAPESAGCLADLLLAATESPPR